MRKKNKKNYGGIFVALFFAFIMITSVVGYIFGGSDTRTAKFGGLKFKLTNLGWQSKINNQVYFFSYNPTEIEDVELPSSVQLTGIQQIDLTYDFNSTFREGMAESIFEMGNALTNHGVFVRGGFTTNTSYEIPIITCDDATRFVPVVYLVESNQTDISVYNYCIIIEGQDSRSFMPIANRLTYQIMGIME